MNANTEDWIVEYWDVFGRGVASFGGYSENYPSLSKREALTCPRYTLEEALKMMAHRSSNYTHLMYRVHNVCTGDVLPAAIL